MTSLYLCYQSILEPLTETQVVAYLEGLVGAGYSIVLLTFEPRRLTAAERRQWRTTLASKGITWYWVRYHKRPTLPATVWDIASGTIVALALTLRHRVDLFHARAHVPGVMAMVAKRVTGKKFLFDVRGLMAEEYVDKGTWPPGGPLFRLTKSLERILVKNADGIVVLSSGAECLLRSWYPRELVGKPMTVIPCCVDLRKFNSAQGDSTIDMTQSPHTTTIAYVGKLSDYYLVDEMASFVSEAKRAIAGLRWQVWTQSNPTQLDPIAKKHGVSENLMTGTVKPEHLPVVLAGAGAGFSFVKPCLPTRACSPTKVGEYLAAGVVVLSTPNIGDTEPLLKGDLDGGESKPVGVIVRDKTAGDYQNAIGELLQLLAEPDIRQRCRMAAERHLSLEHVGWPRYRAVYRQLMDG